MNTTTSARNNFATARNITGGCRPIVAVHNSEEQAGTGERISFYACMVGICVVFWFCITCLLTAWVVGLSRALGLGVAP